jgi:hypothetical protein
MYYTGVVGLYPYRHAPSLTSSLGPVEVEALPSQQVMLSCSSSVLWPPPTSHPASRQTSLLQLIPAVTVDVGHRPSETSPVSSPAFTTSRSPYAAGFFASAFQVLCRFHGLRYHSIARLPLAPLSGLTFRRCRIHLMLRAVVSLLFLRGLHRFSTSGSPNASRLQRDYVAPWRLPRPDLHRLADDDFAGHTSNLLYC